MPIVRRKQGSGLQHRGRIRLGRMEDTPGKKPHPVKTDYFVVKDAPIVSGVYGSEPTRLSCALAGRTVPEVLRAYYERYTGGGALLCQGTGEAVNWFFSRSVKSRVIREGRVVLGYTEDDGTPFQPGDTAPCGGPDNPLYERCEECRLCTVLSFFVLDPNDETHLVGNDWAYYDVSTGSIRAYEHIMDTLTLMEKAANAAGRGLFGVRFTLELVPAEASVTSKAGERIRVSQPQLRMTPSPEWTAFVSAHLLAVAEDAIREPEALPGDVARLPELPPIVINPDEEATPPLLENECTVTLRATVANPPPTLDDAKALILEIVGPDTDLNAIIWKARALAGLGAGQGMRWPEFYQHMVEATIQHLSGQ